MCTDIPRRVSKDIAMQMGQQYCLFMIKVDEFKTKYGANVKYYGYVGLCGTPKWVCLKVEYVTIF